ncbi:hypothetical protein Fleli_3294 [Bernardetia litoralis DSM 6794]|uniref:Lipoprotein n=1 Tax=Bernardetia litoralis (strain ATCC 23117 / DSM 6794 / NBRC 15988 / NCIMB 1366 / Fx l1 / Sio-4) TaxID=880071 RepID=I4ANT8_BERLS|nr:hypothetical protein [Bernardetia litoralis]AFM05623.1 hypothetical protein Fleli_3294 [Bernardetia litoralis DSM 6794]
MKPNLLVSTLILLTCLSLFSCNSSQKTENTKEDTEEISNLEAQPTENEILKDTHSEEEISLERNSELDKYQAEIKLINEKIKEINNELSNYSVKNVEKKVGEISYKIKNYYNKNDNMIKSEFVSDTDSWTLYNIPLSKTDTKLMYGKFVGQLDENTGKPIVRECYSIGSLIKGDETFGLFLDEEGRQVLGKELRKYTTLYEDIFIAN